ncbi:MAG: hypothetical protein HYX41_01505 [Bdellovibrio sp.]|nr:hypothetical protein [Bdellovibrio sp.]
MSATSGRRLIGFFLIALGCFGETNAFSELRQDQIFVAGNQKNKIYRKEGLITGGDRNIQDVIIKDIRRSGISGKEALATPYERLVIDLEGTRNGETTPIPRPPYYQLAIHPKEKQVLLSIWGNPQLAFDTKKVLASFQKSALVKKVNLLPKVEDDLWTFSIELKNPPSIEVFELSSPVRVIVDFAKKSTSGT